MNLVFRIESAFHLGFGGRVEVRDIDGEGYVRVEYLVADRYPAFDSAPGSDRRGICKQGGKGCLEGVERRQIKFAVQYVSAEFDRTAFLDGEHPVNDSGCGNLCRAAADNVVSVDVEQVL